MNHKVFFIKPSRSSDAMPAFHAGHAVVNIARGVETCVVLDLNILNHFKAYQESSAEERSPQLLADIAAIKEILCAPGLFIVAGFAIGEADEAYLEVLTNTYESFLSSELLNYIDAPNAEPLGRDRVRSRKFRSLPEEDQLFFSSTYLALLKIHDVMLFDKGASPEAKFDKYLEYMDRVADFVPGIETEVAKHCFFIAAHNDQDPFLVRSKAIRRNFNKRGSGEKRVDGILNGARDIMYLRGAAMQDGKLLDGKIQDTWLLTTDRGLSALCDSIYFVPTDGEQSKFTAVADASMRQTNSYWRYADKASNYLIATRDLDRRRRKESDPEALRHRLRELARELNERLANATAAS